MTELLNQIVTSGLCIGCGLCESVAGADRITVGMTAEGRERPMPLTQTPLDEMINQKILATCPGTQIHGLPDHAIDPAAQLDDVWGYTLRLARGYAAEPDIRFRGSTGGVLTALAIYLLESGKVNFVLHVAADPEQPMRSKAHISRTRADVLKGTGSRYGPAAPLKEFLQILDRQEPFAFVGKPCDIGAIRNLAKIDERVDRYCLYLLTLVCGGASELTKSSELLTDLGLREEELNVFRYRGYGNPGLTRIETEDGRAFELTYQELWQDEGKWRIQSRCKVCADAIGETADVAASDVWPGGGPTGEDAGFNGVLARTRRGLELVEAAVRDGALVLDQELTPRDMDRFQPHQVRKKEAVWARFAGMRQAGLMTPETSGLRLEQLSQRQTAAANQAQSDGIRQRVENGRFGEPDPTPEKVQGSE